ncbi:MAG: CHAT domain-containing protein [Treponema sp.]|jgi:CHAT domain-containing protein|nr:CHAT domain-containing protein [Treponema sp.]
MKKSHKKQAAVMAVCFLTLFFLTAPFLFAGGIRDERDRQQTHNAEFYYNRGRGYYDKGEYDRAIADFEEALKAAEAASYLNEIFLFTTGIINGIFYNKYPYLITEGDPYQQLFTGLVKDGISRSIKRVEQARSSLGARGSAIMTQALYLYYIGVDFEAHFGAPEKAFEYSESLRSRGFLEQMGIKAALRLPGITTEEQERMRHILAEIENRQNVLAALDADIGSRIPLYGELRNPRPANLAQARQWIPEDTAILEYVLWDESVDFIPIEFGRHAEFVRPAINSYCLVLTKDALVPVTLDHDFNYVQAINDLRYNIIARIGHSVMEDDRNNLYKTLIKPALPHIPNNVKNLIIVPDSTLGHLPFDILREDEDSPDLGEKYRLSLSPSVSVSMFANKTTPRKLPLLGFGGALYSHDKAAATNDISWFDIPGTEAEVTMLEQLIAAQDIRIFRGSDASEASVKRLSAEGELAKYAVIHFATHGYFKEDDLERAGIVLSEVSGVLENGEDGYLTLSEIALLDVNACMVMLSGTETGLGLLKHGDGVVGMVRAFMIAGAENVGVSLWDIDDAATGDFMTCLYAKVLNEGKTFKEAHYLVKDEFRRKGEHPNYWAAFVIYE